MFRWIVQAIGWFFSPWGPKAPPHPDPWMAEECDAEPIQGVVLDGEYMTYDEFLRRQKARYKRSV